VHATDYGGFKKGALHGEGEPPGETRLGRSLAAYSASPPVGDVEGDKRLAVGVAHGGATLRSGRRSCHAPPGPRTGVQGSDRPAPSAIMYLADATGVDRARRSARMSGIPHWIGQPNSYEGQRTYRGGRVGLRAYFGPDDLSVTCPADRPALNVASARVRADAQAKTAARRASASSPRVGVGYERFTFKERQR
jgi:hypothetical protein